MTAPGIALPRSAMAVGKVELDDITLRCPGLTEAFRLSELLERPPIRRPMPAGSSNPAERFALNGPASSALASVLRLPVYHEADCVVDVRRLRALLSGSMVNADTRLTSAVVLLSFAARSRERRSNEDFGPSRNACCSLSEASAPWAVTSCMGASDAVGAALFSS